MSISRIGIISAAAFLFPLATVAQDASQNGGSVWTIVSSSGEDTQVVDPALSETDVRRLTHYSAQALAAIYELDSGTPDQDETIDHLRQKVARLIDAGTRCGYNTTQTADFFKDYVAENRRGDLPTALNGSDGKFESLQLLNSVEAFYLQSQPKTVDVAAVMAEDLEGIKAVAFNATPAQPQPESLQLSATVLPGYVENTLQGPVIPNNADAATQTILSRIEVTGEEWVIEIRQGDSLAQIAYALFRDRLRFNEIYDLNRNTLRSPNLLQVGQVLVLPRNG